MVFDCYQIVSLNLSHSCRVVQIIILYNSRIAVPEWVFSMECPALGNLHQGSFKVWLGPALGLFCLIARPPMLTFTNATPYQALTETLCLDFTAEEVSVA